MRGLCSAYTLDVSREEVGTSCVLLSRTLLAWSCGLWHAPVSYGLSGLNVSSNESCLAGETMTGLALAGILLAARAPTQTAN